MPTHLLERVLSMRVQDGGMSRFRPIHEAIHRLVVLGFFQFGRQRPARMAVNLVREADQTAAASGIPQVCLAEMGLAEHLHCRRHDWWLLDRFESHRHFQDGMRVKRHSDSGATLVKTSERTPVEEGVGGRRVPPASRIGSRSDVAK
jgi:hypothetical protein